MVLKSVFAKGFRNLGGLNGDAGLFLELDKGVNVLTGLNAQGKTNFVEAVYFCATARSHRTNVHRELIRFGEDAAFLRSFVESGGYGNKIEMVLRQSGRANAVKSAAVNGVPIDKLGDLLGILYCVIFSPEDLGLIKSGPGERRRFMDMELCQVSRVYYYELRQYYKILKQRNRLLKSLREGARGLMDTLELWDAQLAESGGRIASMRHTYIEGISVLAAKIHMDVCGEGMTAMYRPSARPEEFAERLKKSRDRDIANGSTGYGVHKDDVMFLIDGLDSRTYGSQGQQRTAALSLKLAEVELIRRDKAESPLLLLDDVMSELDASRQESLLNAVKGLQVIITCASSGSPILSKVSAQALFTVQNGEINRVT